jgi:precorrin-6B methylase 1
MSAMKEGEFKRGKILLVFKSKHLNSTRGIVVDLIKRALNNTVNAAVWEKLCSEYIRTWRDYGREFSLHIYEELIVSILEHLSPLQLRILYYRVTHTFVYPYLGDPFVCVT